MAEQKTDAPLRNWNKNSYARIPDENRDEASDFEIRERERERGMICVASLCSELT